MSDNNSFDAIIIGGSYSGLSATMSLGRSLRKVLVIDSGNPCNLQTPHSHNFLTQDGKTPKEISTIAKSQVEAYETVEFLCDFAEKVKNTGNGFETTTRTGKKFNAKNIILATGVSDQMPAIKGFSDCWGISVVHCPYCHGYEIRGKKTAIMANGERAAHITSLVNNLTKDITLLTNGKADFSPEQSEKFRKHNINIVETELSEIIHENGSMKSVLFTDGSSLDFEAMYAAIPFKQHSEIPELIGCEMTEMGHIKVDNFQKTTINGIFACGDNSTMMRSVALSVSAGNIAGAVINGELTAESF